MINSSLEKELNNYEEKETDISLASRRDDDFISNDCSKNKNNTTDKKFCGTDNINSDGSLVFEVEKDGEITCHLHVPGSLVSLYV